MAITILSELFNIDLNPNKDEELCCKVIEFLVGSPEEDTFANDEMNEIGNIPTEKLWDLINAIIGVNSNS